jgi:hypothetical protein
MNCPSCNHDLHQRWRYEKQGTAQSGLESEAPKGGARFGARPGGKGLGSKNHEASFPSESGSAVGSRIPVESQALVGATGRSPDRAAC